MSALVIFFCLLAGLSSTVLIGPAAAFAAVYMPALLLLNVVPALRLQQMPDLSCAYAAVLGMTIGLLFVAGAERRLRLNLLDAVVVGLGLSAMLTAWTTEVFYTVINVFFEQMLGFVMPYFLARIAFRSPHGRNWMLVSAAGCAAVIGFFALIETRLYPHFYRSLFESMGLYPSGVPRMAYRRWFLFRAESTFEHPIFLGNGCLTLLGLISVLALSVGKSLQRPVVLIGLASAVVGLAASLSFSPYNGLLIGTTLFLLTYALRPVRGLLPVFVILLVTAAGIYTAQTAIAAPSPRPGMERPLADSLWIRQMIIRNTWPLVTTAGPFGYGKRISIEQTQLDSIDNTYMLNGVIRGWVYLGLWLSIPIVLAMQVRRAYKVAWTRQHELMLAIGFATVIATMIAMYTVWAGWAGNPYTMVWLTVVACLTTATQLLQESAVEVMAAQTEPATADWVAGEPA